ncbi:hypothetical protein RDI58_016389 [Solanum bulbocastanum]|uniref:Transcription repressor n=1 Tax=Solanum bulbocastanum TaxID=147425 RepID=A0AAN8TJL7_SOLBU
MLKHQRNRFSFSANLPEDVHGAFADSTCVVKYSMDPLTDIRESIKEMVKNVGIKDWKEMEELVYCYIVLNSEEFSIEYEYEYRKIKLYEQALAAKSPPSFTNNIHNNFFSRYEANLQSAPVTYPLPLFPLPSAIFASVSCSGADEFGNSYSAREKGICS